MVFQYAQSWVIKLCYKPYTKGENRDSYPLNFKRPWRYRDTIINNISKNKHYTILTKCVSFQIFITMEFKDTHRGKTPSNKTPVLAKSMNMDI